MAERLWFSLPSTAQMPSECKSFNCGIIIYRQFFFFFQWYHFCNIDYGISNSNYAMYVPLAPINTYVLWMSHEFFGFGKQILIHWD
jgi:hypothetical protein